MKTKIYIIHGYTANSQSHWFPWLKEHLDNEKVEVILLEMPDSSNPIKKDWLSYLDKHILELNQNTIVIGHSLGCITSLLYLQNKMLQIKGVVLVSGFVEKSPIPELDGFMTDELDYALLKQLIISRISITAKDDDIVPYLYTVEMSKKLESTLIVLDEGKHFLDRDGYYELPVVLECIKRMI